MDPTVLRAITELTVERVDWENIDLLLGIEAMGLPLTAPLSMATGIPLVIVRKRSYGLEGEVEIRPVHRLFEGRNVPQRHQARRTHRRC